VHGRSGAGRAPAFAPPFPSLSGLWRCAHASPACVRPSSRAIPAPSPRPLAPPSFPNPARLAGCAFPPDRI
jgi:hypothetical protein